MISIITVRRCGDGWVNEEVLQKLYKLVQVLAKKKQHPVRYFSGSSGTRKKK